MIPRGRLAGLRHFGRPIEAEPAPGTGLFVSESHDRPGCDIGLIVKTLSSGVAIVFW